MQDEIKNILLGIISNGLTSLLASMWRVSIRGLKRKDTIATHLAKDSSIATILQKAVAELAKNISIQNKQLKEKLQLFLSSPDVEGIVRQLYSSHIIQDGKDVYIESIQKEFLASLALYVDIEKQGMGEVAASLFDAMHRGCEQALKIAIDKGILSAHEAKSAERHSAVLDELSSVQKNLEYLVSQTNINIAGINEFERKYRKQIISRHGHIIPPHFDAARKIPIDDIYVSPKFDNINKQANDNNRLLTLSEFVSLAHRSVVLGNPGGGKSTLASKLCHDLAHQYTDRLLSNRLLTPILVILRDYGAERRSKGHSILQFIEQTSNSKYQIKPPNGTFEYLLLNGRVAVIFDGLDELLDTSYRQEITDDVEAFCNLFPAVPIIVTSREVGYEEAPLTESKFDIYRLAPFNDTQVEHYAKLWFGTDRDLSSAQQNQKVKSFLRESGVVPDLRSNPLMLALMCNIYRGENYIPKNRPDVYEKCALMLFERWDKSRGIHVSLSIEAHIRTAMMFLAHWIYSTPALQAGATESNLTSKATEYLCPRRFEDRVDAEKAAKEFIEFCRGRAWVFTDTGTTKEGERLYQFTHRTFLEYFTAAHLARTHYTPDDLSNVLVPRISKREWDVVAQLAIQLQNKNIESAGDKILSNLIDLARMNRTEEGLNSLSFVAKCLEFMVPSPKTSREISLLCCDYILSFGDRNMEKQYMVEDIDGPDGSPESKKMEELLPSILTTSIENRDTIAKSLEKLLIDKINAGSEKEAVVAFELGCNLTLPLSLKHDVNYDEIVHYWNSVEERIYLTCKDRIAGLTPKYIRVAITRMWRDEISIEDMIEWYGAASLFSAIRFVLFSNVWTTSIADVFLHSLIRDDESQKAKKKINSQLGNLDRLGRILLNRPTPWILRKQRTIHSSIRRLFESSDHKMKKPVNLTADVYFGALIILATILEASAEDKYQKNIRGNNHPLVEPCRNILAARFESMEDMFIEDEMHRIGFSSKQKEFLYQWIRKEINFVAV